MTCLVLQILIFRFMRPVRALHSTLVGFLLQCMGRLWWLPVHILAISKGVRNPRSKISSFCSPCCHEETPVHYLSVHLVSQVKLLLVFFCWTLLEEQKPLQKDRMNLTKPDKSIFASRLANPERRPRLASGWRPKPKERFRCTEERMKLVEDSATVGRYSRCPWESSMGTKQEGLDGVTDLMVNWDYCLQCCSRWIQAF